MPAAATTYRVRVLEDVVMNRRHGVFDKGSEEGCDELCSKSFAITDRVLAIL